MECYLERVFYYWRHGMFGHAEAVCRIGLEDKPSNLFLIIYHSLSIGMMRRTDEAIQLASKLSQRKDLILLYQTSLFCIHSHANPKNEAVMDELRSNIISKIESSNPLALYHAAQIAWMFNERWIYKGILKHCKEKQINFPNLSVLKGWMMLKASHAKSALKKFDSVLEDKTKSFDILALYGKALCYAYMNDYSDSVQVYARILSKYDFPELNVEKCRIYIQMERWEYSYSIAQELKEKLFSKVEPDIIIAMNSLLRSESEQDVSAILDIVNSKCPETIPDRPSDNPEFTVQYQEDSIDLTDNEDLLLAQCLRFLNLFIIQKDFQTFGCIMEAIDFMIVFPFIERYPNASAVALECLVKFTENAFNEDKLDLFSRNLKIMNKIKPLMQLAYQGAHNAWLVIANLLSGGYLINEFYTENELVPFLNDVLTNSFDIV